MSRLRFARTCSACACPLALAVALVLMACGTPEEGPSDSEGESTESGNAPAVAVTDPCAVVTVEDVLAVTGSEPAPPSRVTPVAGGVSYCDWRMASDTTQTLVTVMAIPAPAMSYDEFLAQTRSVLEEAFDETEYEPVEGVGDAAVWSYGSTLQTWAEGHMVQIQSGVGGPALDREASADLARRAIERL